jgi:hypothetical protein
MLTGLCMGLVCSLAFAAEPERQPAASALPATTCIYDNRVFTAGAMIVVPPDNRIHIQCSLATIELNGAQHSYWAWKVLGTQENSNDAKKPAAK